MRTFLLTTIVVLSACGMSAQADDGESQPKALAALQKLGLDVTVDETKPGKPVVGLDFHRNKKVTDADLVHLKEFPNLRRVNLGRQQITDAGLEHLKVLTLLEGLDLGTNDITDAGLEHLKVLTHLKGLDLRFNKITAAGLERLKGLTNLQRLILAGARIADDDMVLLTARANLRVLHLRQTLITDKGVRQLKKLTKLEILNLMNTKTTDAGLEALKDLTELRALDLDGTAITDGGLQHLKALRNLERLQMAGTKVSDGGLEHLQALSNLKQLSIARTKVTDEGVNKLKQRLPKLQVAWYATVAAQASKKPEPGEGKPKVVRDRVKGSIHHVGGKTQWWERITGHAKVLDAHTLQFEESTRVPLLIVAPDLDQMGMIDGSLYPCGKEAAEFLRKLIGDRTVTCYLVEAQNKWFGWVGDTNIEQEMIINGWALAHHNTMNIAEIIARENKRGLWRGQFIDPDEWRAGKRLLGEK